MLRYATDWNEYVNRRFEHPEHIPFIYKENPLRSTSEFIDGLRRSVDCYVEYGNLDAEIVQPTTWDRYIVPEPRIPDDVIQTIEMFKRFYKKYLKWAEPSQDEESSEVSQELTDFLLSIMGGGSE